jgi:glycosyltransferase involved in cell wall biosynthesis
MILLDEILVFLSLKTGIEVILNCEILLSIFPICLNDLFYYRDFNIGRNYKYLLESGIIIMKLLIDEGLSTLVKLTGIGHYSVELEKCLKNKVEKTEISNYYYLKALPKIFRRLSYLYLSNLNAFKDYDVVHFTNYYVPPLKLKAKYVVTIHDFTPFVFPETLSKSYIYYLGNTIRKAVKRANRIILLSEYAKEELRKYLNFKNFEKVDICYDGIRNIFFRKERSSVKILEGMGLVPFKYIFFIGTLERRKNIVPVLKVFKKMNLKKIKFVLVGKPGFGYEEIRKEIDGVKVIQLGYLKDEQLLAIYDYSLALVFPSLYEGFGMPIIEAMARNIPIIASDITTTLELNNRHNDQFLIFELDNEVRLIKQIMKVVKDFENVRNSLNYGDLAVYDWNNISKQHLTVYKKALEE